MIKKGFYICAILTAYLALQWSPTPAHAQITEDHIKSVYLYNFLSFISWKDTKTPVLCVYGNDDIYSNLEGIVRAPENKISFKPKQLNDFDDVLSCHIVFLSQDRKRKREEMLEAVAGHPILTVSDIRKFANKGGIIEFQSVGDRIKLKVNIANAKQHLVKISSRLLKISEVVQ